MEKNNYTQVNQDQIKQATSTNAVCETRRILKNKIEQSSFDIGDVVVLQNRDTGKFHSISHRIKKWVISYIDDFGLVYTREILSSGDLSKKMSCITIKYLNAAKFINDPEHLNSLLLGEEGDYDPCEEARNIGSLKNKVRRINKKKLIDNNIADNLVAGDTIWKTLDMLGDSAVELTVISVKKYKNKFLSLKVKGKDKNSNSTLISSLSIFHHFKEKPITIKDLI